MKPEPLRDKQRYYLDAVPIHHDDTIESAVEWLKEEICIHSYLIINEGGTVIKTSVIKNLINKAFEDVIIKPDKGEKDE